MGTTTYEHYGLVVIALHVGMHHLGNAVNPVAFACLHRQAVHVEEFSDVLDNPLFFFLLFSPLDAGGLRVVLQGLTLSLESLKGRLVL